MGLSVFEDKKNPPADNDLSKALGSVKKFWDEIKSFVTETCHPIAEDWKHYGKNSGWCMKLLKKKRNLFFSYPGKDEFWVGFVFGDKAVKAANESDLPATLINELNQARKYMEGRGLRVRVCTAADVDLVKKLISIKVSN